MNTETSETHPKIKLTIDQGESAQTEYEFTDAFQIGRSEACQVNIFNDTVSRIHLEVYYKQNHWWIKDLQSSNGTFVDGERIQEKQLTNNLTVALGIDGPRILLEIESQQKTEATSSPDKRSMTQVMQKYFVDTLDEKVGEHTMMIRHTFRLMQQKQKQKYFKLIAVFIVLCVIIGTYAIFKHLQFNKQVKLAEDNFYNMKVLEVKLVQLETAVTEENGTSLLDQIKSVRLDFYQREETYDQSIGNLGVYKGRVSEENRIILKVARIFGECELNMPPGFVNEVKNYIKKWQSTNRLEKAIKRAEQNSFKHKIVEEMLRYHLPPQFFYLALQESDFELNKCGPETRHGYAKGMWQFIPETARKYNLRVGPLSELRRPDPRDDRHHFEKSTEAAAQYIRDIYATRAQASGLLVMASYNWGEDKVIKLLDRLPENPRERNFWKLLEHHHNKIPFETYNYVFYIVSAAVIGENPRLFGFKFDNPLQETIKKIGDK